MDHGFDASKDVHVLPTLFPVPGLGFVPVNAFVLRAAQPVLVDTGLIPEQEAFMAALRAVIEPRELRWLWLTHVDPDHVGSLQRLLDEAPALRVVGNFITAGKLGLLALRLPLERLFLVNPGQTVDAGDRKLRAIRPPTFDAPETMGFLDESSGTLFSSDCFGAVLAGPARLATDLPPDELMRRQVLWATVDAPWLHSVDRSLFFRSLDLVRGLAPPLVLSSHLPPAERMTDRLIESLAAAVDAQPFCGPDDAALRAMLASAHAAASPQPQA
jgi:glyoxylase-like metal-dependent hydrolase (beta-lactamase superfamily II)